jgi:hypothetical protein
MIGAANIGLGWSGQTIRRRFVTGEFGNPMLLEGDSARTNSLNCRATSLSLSQESSCIRSHTDEPTATFSSSTNPPAHIHRAIVRIAEEY